MRDTGDDIPMSADGEAPVGRAGLGDHLVYLVGVFGLAACLTASGG